MNREEIIRMAREAGIDAEKDTLCRFEGWVEPIERFAALVAAAERERIYFETSSDFVKSAVAAEREACAKLCDDGVQNATDWDSSYWDQACENRAAAIRARGQK